MPKGEFKDDNQRVTITIDPNFGRIDVGTKGRAGEVIVRNGVTGNQELFLGGADGLLIVGGNERDGRIQVLNQSAQTVIRIDAQSASVGVGTDNPARRLHVDGSEIHSGGVNSGMSFGNRETAGFTSNPGERWVWYSTGNVARLWSAGDRVAVTSGGRVGIGTTNPARRLHVEGEEIHSGGAAGGMSFGNRETAGFTSNPGERWVWYSSGKTARLWSGGDKIVVTPEGDIQLLGADCSEDFDVDEPDVEPGTVMVLTDGGGLRASDTEYDTRVAGVVAGAGPYRPGIVLDRREGAGPRCSVALVGKVFCKADAGEAPIRTGDLLATAGTAGHAMRVTDQQRAFGAVLGKAMGPLASGRGEIPVLVALQ